MQENVAEIAFISNTDFGLYDFRLGLIYASLAKGFVIDIIIPDEENVGKLIHIGENHHSLKIDRRVTDLPTEIYMLWRLYPILKKDKFDAIHSYIVKPNIHGNIAAKLARISVGVGVGVGVITPCSSWLL
jgi:hypothetical protein